MFHGVDEEYPREKATESFLSALENESAHNCFAGAYLPGLDLAGETVTTPDERPIDLRGAIVDGVVDLTDARITVPVILDGASVNGEIEAKNAVFEGAEFIVEPTFEDARFATDPALEDAEFLTNIDASVEERYRRWELVLVHPESFDNTDMSVPTSEVHPGFTVPVDQTHLAEENPRRTKAVLDGTTIAGVYERTDDAIEFSHLAANLSELDHLVPVPAADTAFEAGAVVAAASEARTAMIRHERFRLRLSLDGATADGADSFGVHRAVVPLLIAAGA